MRASYNIMARAYFIKPDGTIGTPSGDAFPARHVTAQHIQGEGPPYAGPWSYLTCDRLFVLPTFSPIPLSASVLADYSLCSAIAIPATGLPTLLAITGQLVTPYLEPSYYRYTLVPFPF